MVLVGFGLSWHWRLSWFAAGPDDDFDSCLMIGPLQLFFSEEKA